MTQEKQEPSCKRLTDTWGTEIDVLTHQQSVDLKLSTMGYSVSAHMNHDVLTTLIETLKEARNHLDAESNNLTKEKL